MVESSCENNLCVLGKKWSTHPPYFPIHSQSFQIFFPDEEERIKKKKKVGGERKRKPRRETREQDSKTVKTELLRKKQAYSPGAEAGPPRSLLGAA